MVLEEDVIPRRRVRIVERLRSEEPEELLARDWVVRRAERRPVGLGLEVARHDVLQRQAGELQRRRRRRSRAAPPRARPCRRAVASRRAIRYATGNANSAYQPIDFQMWLCARWPSSCASTKRSSRGVNGGSTIGFQKKTRRLAPRPVENAFGSRDAASARARNVDVLDTLEPRARMPRGMRCRRAAREQRTRAGSAARRTPARRAATIAGRFGALARVPSRSRAPRRAGRTASPSASQLPSVACT